MSDVVVKPRGAGVSLSVDVIVDGCQGNVPLPFNYGTEARIDSLVVDGQGWRVRVEPGATFIADEHIERFA